MQGEDGTFVLGERYTLQTLSGPEKVLPTHGRLAVCFGDSAAQALLELPCSTSKNSEEISALATGIWVTVGLLAQNRFALQLRLKRKTTAAIRSKDQGIWHLYVPIGGALTVLKEIKLGKENTKPMPVVMELD